jgi:hypothetical protein
MEAVLSVSQAATAAPWFLHGPSAAACGQPSTSAPSHDLFLRAYGSRAGNRSRSRSRSKDTTSPPPPAALHAIHRAASVQELVAAARLPGVLQDPKIALQAILQAPRAVHIPMHPSESLALLPALDTLTLALARSLPQLSMQEVAKVLGVCRLLRFVPGELLDSLSQRVSSEQSQDPLFTTSAPSASSLAEMLHCACSMLAPRHLLLLKLSEACSKRVKEMEPAALTALLQVGGGAMPAVLATGGKEQGVNEGSWCAGTLSQAGSGAGLQG